MLSMRKTSEIVCGVIAVCVAVSIAAGVSHYHEEEELRLANSREVMEKICEERDLLKEETISYKYFIREEIYNSELLGKITPNTTFAPDGEIISHGGRTSFTRDYTKNEGEMGYILYAPTCTETYEELPLIVYLHGAGEARKSVEKAEEVGGLPHALSKWKLDVFHAYVLCPQNPGGYWMSEDKKEAVMSLIERICVDYPINTDKVSIVGHSSGGGGCLYVNARSNGYFCAVVPISSVKSSPNEHKLNGAKLRAYLAVGDGEGNLKWYYETKLKPIAGKEQCFVVNSTHLNSGEEAFEEDKNKDGKSDLIEWILSQKREN